MDARILDDAYDDDFQATKTPKSSFRAQFVGAIGNLAIQYNFSALGIAVAFMTSHQDTVTSKTNGLSPDFPEPAWASNALYGTVFVGAILGQITMGRVGDLIGRRKGMCLTLAFVVIGSLASALFTWGPPNVLFAVLAACRFILGFGVGGIYPMAAATAHEAGGSGDDDGDDAHAAHTAAESRVGWAFFWQSPGAMVPYVIAIPLLAMPHATWTTDVQFRVLLGCGSLVALVPLIAAFYAPEGPAAAGSSGHKSAFRRASQGTADYYGLNVGSEKAAGARGAFFMDDDGDVVPAAAARGGRGSTSWEHWVTLIGTGGGYARTR
jgi:MFS family permease